jgi:hypothetical protein
MITKSTVLATKLKSCHPPDMNRDKNLQNYSPCTLWTSSPLLQTNFISPDILRAHFKIFSYPFVFYIYVLFMFSKSLKMIKIRPKHIRVMVNCAYKI